MDTKTCPNCKQTKPVTEFGKDKNRTDGYYPQCKECRNRKAREAYQRPEIKARKAEYQKLYLADPEKHELQKRLSKQWYERKKDDPDFMAKERERFRQYDQSERGKERDRKYRQSEKGKEYHRRYAQEKGIPRAKERYHNEPAFRERMRNAIKKWFQSDKGKRFRESPEQKEYSRQYRKNNLERIRAREKYKYNNDPEYHARVRTKNNIRIERKRANGGTLTKSDWEYLLKLSEDQCLCCGTKGNLVMDHIIPIVDGGKTDIDNIQPLCATCNARKGAQSTDYRTTSYINEVLAYQTNRNGEQKNGYKYRSTERPDNPHPPQDGGDGSLPARRLS